MELHRELENIFKFRISSNDEINAYIHKMANIGKLDLPKQVQLYSLILQRVGSIEDRLKVLESKKVIEEPVKVQASEPIKVEAKEPNETEVKEPEKKTEEVKTTTTKPTKTAKPNK